MSKNFDITVTRYDSKTGKVTEHSPYILRVSDKGQIYERPPHSGIFYNPDGTLLAQPVAKEVEAPKVEASKAEVKVAPQK